MLELDLKILTVKEYLYLEQNTPGEFYDWKTAGKLNGLVDRLKAGLRRATSPERKMYKSWSALPCGVLFPKKVRVKGNFAFPGRVRVEGVFEGSLAATESLTVECGGEVRGKVSSAAVFCDGTILGDIRASGSVEVASGARVEGDIHAPAVKVHKGARFEGRCSITKKQKDFTLQRVDSASATHRRTG
ncbi:MAG: hypothetical protein COV67_08500 [Nitrospinae bacterium CG11_big_fil_rev_8_21_14_0_20_56_8]|nr:MAG: hypothetical protein COV67_08500 [Nitrospinae bacterium CG11_big_fil_rev_8_21_14_0_20_56_8]